MVAFLHTCTLTCFCLPREHLILSTRHSSFNLLSFLRRTSNASLPSQGFWSKLKPGGKNVKEAEMRQQQQQQQQQMALSRQRLLTLVYDEMETVRMVCTSYLLASPCCPRLTQCSQSFQTPLSYGHIQCASPLIYIYHTSQELDALARDWAKPPPDALFGLRVPIDYVHIQTAVRLAHATLHIHSFSHML